MRQPPKVPLGKGNRKRNGALGVAQEKSRSHRMSAAGLNRTIAATKKRWVACQAAKAAAKWPKAYEFT